MELKPSLLAMLKYRCFRNTDPPELVSIWQSRRGQRGLFHPVSVDLFEQFIFGKLHFDSQGLIVALEDDRPVGFAHAAFGPNQNDQHPTPECGVTCVVVVRPDCLEAEVAAGLLAQCEEYLVRHGTPDLFGGAFGRLNPFYLGLYGGCELPGVLDSDAVAHDLYLKQGYEIVDRTRIFRRDLDSFRTKIDRQQMQLRRQTSVRETIDPPPRTWWEACTTVDFDLIQYDLIAHNSEECLATVTIRAMEAVYATIPGRQAGVINLEVATDQRRRGLGTYLLGETFRRLVQQGFSTIEAQTTEQNAPALELFTRLGFEPVDLGTVFHKTVRQVSSCGPSL